MKCYCWWEPTPLASPLFPYSAGVGSKVGVQCHLNLDVVFYVSHAMMHRMLLLALSIQAQGETMDDVWAIQSFNEDFA